MGAWYKKPSQLQKKWKYVYAASTSTVYNMETIPVQANFITLTKRNRYEIMDIDMEYTDNIPNDIQPISEISNTTFDFNPNHSFHTPPKKIIRTWQEYIQTLPHYEQIMLKYTIIQKPILLQQTFEQQEEIIICSDGALKEKKSGGAFVIATKTEEILVTNKNPDTGHNYFQSSYRSEAQACYSAFLFIFFYCKYHNIQAPSIMYYCDNKGLITRLNNPHKQIASMKECELIQLIQNISKPGQVYKHVYAHQDLKLKALSTPEYINTIADLIASKNRVITRQVHSPKLIAIYQGGKYIPHDITRFLRKTAFLHQAKMFVRNKYEWTNQTYENIHWEAYTTSIYTPSYKQRQQRLKYVHGRLPIGNLNFEATITCPHCNTSELDIQGTTQDHFLCCPGITSYQKTRLAKITKRLTKNHTPPTIRSLIIHLIIHHYNNTPIPPQHPSI